MGCDISVALGKIKPLAIGYQRKGAAIRLDGIGEDLDFSQFEFIDYKQESGYYDGEDNDYRNIPQDYNLFSWLAGIRGDLQPVLPVEDLKKLHDLTIEFTRWAAKEDRFLFEEDAKARGVQPSYDGYGYRDDWTERVVGGDHSHVIYPLLFLKGFDYEQKVRVQEKDEWESMDSYLKRLEEYRDYTYRSLFSPGYFGFLDWAVDNGWQFAIFSFDS